MNRPKNGEDDTPEAGMEIPANDTLDLGSNDIAREAAQIAGLQAELADIKDRYLRAVAEVENVRKRAEREKQDAAQYAFGRFAKDLLNVTDNFARAFDSLKPETRATLPADVHAVVQGIEATQREMFTIMERHGVKRIEAMGQRFNPNLHQAVAEVPSADHPPGTVINVAQQGYMIGGRLLREAIVVVTTQAPAQANNGNGGYPPAGSAIDTSA